MGKSNLRQTLRQKPGPPIENKVQEEPTGVDQELGIDLLPDTTPKMEILQTEINPKKETLEALITIKKGPETHQLTESGQAMMLGWRKSATTLRLNPPHRTSNLSWPI